MGTKLLEVAWHNGGWCRQMGWFAGRRSLRFERFYAVFVSFRHPTAGPCLIDAGYGPSVWQASRRLPARAHRWATPLALPPTGSPRGVLQQAGVDPASINRVFVSHFHVDHIGGLREFEGVPLVARPAALDELRRLPEGQQVHNGFLAGLVPDDFDTRCDAIDENAFAANDELGGLASLDYFGDGSLLLVDLPGHAVGHTGYVFNTNKGRVFYVVDATWDVKVLQAGRRLPWISGWLQNDLAAYYQAQAVLRTLAAELSIVACHCPTTQPRVGDH
ncbi:MAG: MBL fold metallo-hydrolase [Planctomycetota bacterium]